MIKKLRLSRFMKYIFIISLIISGFIIILYIFFKKDLFDTLLALIAVNITIFIAWTQEIQLNKLEYIGIQTKETTEKLNTDSKVLSSVQNFFAIKDNARRYKLFFPVEYDAKPLPLINQGDFYAVHVISSRIGEDNIDLEKITKKTDPKNILIEGDAIFICAPHANPALEKIYPFKKIETDKEYEELKNSKWPIEGLDLPCWFIEDHREPNRITGDRWKTRKIWIHETKEPIPSPAEYCYQLASAIPSGIEFVVSTNIQQDYGILARVNNGKNQYIMIAGMHQYGTWIVGSFLSNLLGGKDDVDNKSTFLGNEDFIAIIWGEYNNNKMTVNSKRIGVERKLIWTKSNGQWIRI